MPPPRDCMVVDALFARQLYRQLFESINCDARFVWTPSQIFKIHATIFENAPISGRSGALVKDDAILAIVDELRSDGTLGFDELNMTPTKLESILGKVPVFLTSFCSNTD